MIIFRNLKWKNLLSTGNYYTEVNLSNNSNTLVVGENGSGKSTMLDALCFALFGKPFRSINKPQLINSINNKDCVVEVTFDTNNKAYRIVRGIKPNIFEIYCNNELINQEAASRDYQEFLEKFILKLNYKSFTQIVILGSASFTPFMQLSASDRRAIIEDLLDIQIFSTMNTILKEKLSSNKDFISDKKHNIDLIQQKYDLQKKYIEELKQNNDDKVKEYESEIQSHGETISTLSSNVEVLATEVQSLHAIVEAKIETEAKVKKITKIESQIESNLSKFRKDISFFQSHNDCPTCRQTIAMEFKEEELGNLSTRVTECEHGLQQLEEKLNAEQEKLNDIANKQRQLNEKQVQIATLNTTITETNKMIARLTKLANELKESKSVTDLEEQELNLASLDFFVNFNLDESFKETIKSRHRDEFTYASFSEGEKQRIDMALMLTWRAVAKLKNSSNTNLLILDETFDSSLDTNGTEELMKILHLLEGVNLFVISHKGDILQDKFANVIRFKKEKNFSRIVK